MKKSCLGFTLIELLVVISIIGILFVIGIAQYMNFNRRQILDQATQELKSNLRLAQTMASSGEKPTGCTTLDGYRVNFSSGGSTNPDNYQIQAKCSPEGLVGTAKTFSLPSVVKFSSVPSPILFKVLAQGTDLPTDLTISLTGFGQPRSITVTKTGKIE